MNDELSGIPMIGVNMVGCLVCAAPAAVVGHYVLESTDGPIEHATVPADGHRFTVLVERLTTPRAAWKEARRWAPRST